MTTLIVIKAAWDPDAGVWCVEHSDLPGLNLEAESLEALRDKLPGALEDLMEAAGQTGEREVQIEIIAHARVRGLLTPRLRAARPPRLAARPTGLVVRSGPESC